jgi:hypothetical protein
VALALPQFDTLSMGMSADLEAAVFGGVDLLQIAGFRHRIYKYSLTGIPHITAQQ